MRTLVIGDIHGGYRALEQLINRIQITREDRLVFLGDYVDGWSESRQVIDLLIELNRSYNCVFIKGNHDLWCEEWLSGSGKNPVWLLHGGNATIASYAEAGMTVRNEHLSFFKRMLPFWKDEANNLYIHAGFSSMHGPEKETYSTNYSWDRTLWETALALDPLLTTDSLKYPKRLKLFREIYIGHTPVIDYGSEFPMHAANVWNIDTGAAFTGKLSALDVATKQFWQSDNLRKLYPDEKGRNKD